MPKPWQLLREKPVFTLTSDQDWAPPWAAKELLDRVAKWKLPLHVFRTSPCPVFDAAAKSGRFSQGWHPNFLPRSTQGSTPKEVIAYLQSHFPGARTVRGHEFVSFSSAAIELRNAGILVDSHVATAYQEELLPLMHWTGTLGLPVYFEDDVFFKHDPDRLNLDWVAKTLFSPGLKILNFHAVHVGINAPSEAHYQSVRDKIYAPTTNPAEIRYPGRGTSDVLDELVELVLSNDHSFVGFEELGLQLRDEAPSSFQSLRMDTRS